MNDTRKKEMGSFVGGGGVGFLIGYFWPRKKTGSGEIELSNLVVPSDGASGDPAVITVDATNTSPTTQSSEIVLVVGYDRYSQVITLSPGQTTTVSFEVVLNYFSDQWRTYALNVTVSVSPLMAMINYNPPS